MTERRMHEESHGAWWNPAPTLGRRPFLRTAAAPSLLAGICLHTLPRLTWRQDARVTVLETQWGHLRKLGCPQ